MLRQAKRKRAKRHTRSVQVKYNKEMKKTANYNTEEKYYTFHVPLKFGIINNPEETVRFFNEIISFISDKRDSGKRLFIDISKVSELTIDALMYLLAISNNIFTAFNNRCTFPGTWLVCIEDMA